MKKKVGIHKDKLGLLVKLKPVYSLGAILLEWAMISLAIFLHKMFPYTYIYILVWFFIGTRMYALYALLHDGIHYLIYPSKKVNDAIVAILLAFPLFISLRKIRETHFAHHAHLKTENDPENVHGRYTEFQFPMPWYRFFKICFLDIIGFNFLWYWIKKKWIRIQKKDFFNTLNYLKLGLLILFCMILWIFDSWLYFILYWFIPYITIYQLLNRLRLSSEHLSIKEECMFETRTVKASYVERFFFWPKSIGFHTEHHMYPSVPFYHLPHLHKQLMKEEPYKTSALVNTSYVFVIKEFIK